MVSLAKKLEGRPFHLVATHCQNQPRESVVAYIKGKGLSASAPNFTVTSFGGHPDVKGNGYVPYYMVFDHHGNLVHHHMCGAYHGGDGMKFIEVVEKHLANAPEIYVGREPYTQVTALAGKISAGKDLATAARSIESRLAAAEPDAAAGELKRLLQALTRYRDRKLAHAERLLASKPAAVVPALKVLGKELTATKLGEPVHKRLKELDGSKGLKAAVKIAKKFTRYRKALDALKCCDGCKRNGLKRFQHGCSGCAGKNAGLTGVLRKKLVKLVDGHEDLPITPTVLTYAEALER